MLDTIRKTGACWPMTTSSLPSPFRARRRPAGRWPALNPAPDIEVVQRADRGICDAAVRNTCGSGERPCCSRTSANNAVKISDYATPGISTPSDEAGRLSDGPSVGPMCRWPSSSTGSSVSWPGAPLEHLVVAGCLWRKTGRAHEYAKAQQFLPGATRFCGRVAEPSVGIHAPLIAALRPSSQPGTMLYGAYERTLNRWRCESAEAAAPFSVRPPQPAAGDELLRRGVLRRRDRARAGAAWRHLLPASPKEEVIRTTTRWRAAVLTRRACTRTRTKPRDQQGGRDTAASPVRS